MTEKKRALVTAGATLVPIDQVRAITNIFKGKTGTEIAKTLLDFGWEVTLVTSNPGLVEAIIDRHLEDWEKPLSQVKLKVVPYKTFDDLAAILEEEIRGSYYDLVVHSAAVSDYKVTGVSAMDELGQLHSVDASTKISSTCPKLYLELSPTPKLIDQFRKWGFEGLLVKFKLQVGKTDGELLRIAKDSLLSSKADLIVANCLEWADRYAYVVDACGDSKSVSRSAIGVSIHMYWQEH
ncbi:MAG TPA: phosphopantothenoylcysteine decarboxylase [Candidatus Magasanikbacteria bacterium]|nr:phosphopantothenoylcysteine decarboxylase [Candidatus Magasanikbacteria bacterium]